MQTQRIKQTRESHSQLHSEDQLLLEVETALRLANPNIYLNINSTYLRLTLLSLNFARPMFILHSSKLVFGKTNSQVALF